MLYYECSFASLIFLFSFASIKVYFSRKFSWYISLIFNLEFRLTCCKMYNFSTIKKLLFFLSLSNMHLHSNIKSTVFVVLAVHEQVALMSFSWSKIRLLLYVHEQFAMSMHLLCSTVLHLWLLLCANNSAVETSKHIICHLPIFRSFGYTSCVLLYISLAVTTSSWMATWKALLL